MADNRIKNARLEDVRILWPNFSGAPTQWVAGGGVRSFCVAISRQQAGELAQDGWNINTLEGDDEQNDVPYIRVAVSYKNRPPKVVLVSGDTMRILHEEDIDILDGLDFQTVDVVLSPYHWELNGRQGVKAYLKTLYVVEAADEFERKYADKRLVSTPATKSPVDRSKSPRVVTTEEAPSYSAPAPSAPLASTGRSFGRPQA